uniref:protein acetyllysine N-acetyltransferase n=1 Tax=Cacopsylla melanoneura TaxID=428564 RepID=A0A8D8ZMP9_9HEMI
MSCSYAEGLSAYENKGKLGEPETFDSKEELARKIRLLSQWIEESKHVVLHTGAGISTSAGIPDFRGPNGVWTLEKKGIKPKINISFDDAVPTPTHMAITELVKQNKVHYIVSQNIDGLHLRSGLSRKHLAELHGNMYVDQCNKCDRDIVHVGVHCTTQYSTGNIIYLRKILILVTTTRALLTLVSAWVPRYKLIQVACYQRTQRNITKGNWLSVICPVQNMTKKPTF